jgi:nucleotide-binding universal stress UspA family protein
MPVLLAAVDGSENARRAAARAIDAAVERDADLHCLYVVDRRIKAEPGLSSAELSTIDAEDRGHAFLDEVENDARTRACRVTRRVAHGIPEHLVAEYAETVDADVVVVGEHARDDDHLGGVGRRIADATDRDVLPVGDRIDAAR